MTRGRIFRVNKVFVCKVHCVCEVFKGKKYYKMLHYMLHDNKIL
jgi:hypothetical protein